MTLAAGALLGLISVAFGAYAEHALQASVDAAVFESLETAIRYNQIHAVMVTAIGLACLRPDRLDIPSGLVWAAWGFVAGTVLFSFSIYLAASTGTPALNAAAPFGGVLLMISWAGLAWTGIRSLRA